MLFRSWRIHSRKALRLEAPDALPAKDARAVFPGDSLARDCYTESGGLLRRPSSGSHLQLSGIATSADVRNDPGLMPPAFPGGRRVNRSTGFGISGRNRPPRRGASCPSAFSGRPPAPRLWKAGSIDGGPPPIASCGGRRSREPLRDSIQRCLGAGAIRAAGLGHVRPSAAALAAESGSARLDEVHRAILSRSNRR